MKLTLQTSFYSIALILVFLLSYLLVKYKLVIPSTLPPVPVLAELNQLLIPGINVNAKIQTIKVTPKGEMEVPSNITDVGWYNLGPRPGDKGSAVIAGHLNGPDDKPGVFINLFKLKPGDKLSILDKSGLLTNFVVRKVKIFPPGYAEEVFSTNDSAHLNLITCDGLWDGLKKSYDKRLVVFTDKIN